MQQSTIDNVHPKLQHNSNTSADVTTSSPNSGNTLVGRSALYNADCFDVFPFIEDKSIDAIICDLPYGTTACKWDSILPLDKLWKEYERIIKDDGAIILFGSEPFSSLLRISKLDLFKYDWIWVKNTSSNFLQANYQPIKRHENILVFSKSNASFTKKNNKMKYFPILNENEKVYSERQNQSIEVGLNAWKDRMSNNYEFKRNKNKGTFPKSVIEFAGKIVNKNHPTEKPLELMEYLIKTYTNEGETVLDNCMGSGTTGVACKQLNRQFIGIEKETNYYNIAVKRISEMLF
jgi:site-specific DNA-methyltransferase (adenine-specific)